jgi:hypothetical protein
MLAVAARILKPARIVDQIVPETGDFPGKQYPITSVKAATNHGVSRILSSLHDFPTGGGLFFGISRTFARPPSQTRSPAFHSPEHSKASHPQGCD